MKFLVRIVLVATFVVISEVGAQMITPERVAPSASRRYQPGMLDDGVFLGRQTNAEYPDGANALSDAQADSDMAGMHPAQHGEHERPAGSEYPSLHMVGFGDVNFSATNDSGSKSGFNEGQFVLHFSSALSAKVSFVGELSFTARSDAGTGSPPAPGFNPEVERAIIRFDQSDYLKISLGRYHTPINWWNTEFHHGLWLQTSISRPEMTKFGGTFIPVHFVGGLIEGALPASGMNVNYSFGLGNGRGTVTSRAGDAGDNNNNRAWLANIYVRPDALFGLQVGGAVYNDKITLANGHEFGEWIASGHLVWRKEDPEFIAEVANIQHKDVLTDVSYNNISYYVQLGYRLPILDNVLKPYVRYEYMKIDVNDEVFRLVPGLNETTAGIRYDISELAALKGEYRNVRHPGRPNYDALFMQVCFTF